MRSKEAPRPALLLSAPHRTAAEGCGSAATNPDWLDRIPIE